MRQHQPEKGKIAVMVYRVTALVIVGVLGIIPVAAESTRPLVGHIMALLAVFEEATVLPPETSPQANALIHALIQTQAALTKSTNTAARTWFADALQRADAPGSEPLPHDRLTSRTLEAILAHAATHPPVERPAVLAGLREFNIGQADLDLMTRIYEKARDRLRSTGQDIHRVYNTQRQTMPFP